jgi:FkbM family methyltransferase
VLEAHQINPRGGEIKLAKEHLRTRVLTAAGESWPVTTWARSKSKPFGVEVRRTADGLELRKGNRAVLLAAKHAFFAPEVACSFDIYAHGLPSKENSGIATVDFASVPNSFNLFRKSLSLGVIIEAKEGNLWVRKDQRAIILPMHHLVYGPDVSENFERYYSPLVPELRDGIEVLDYSQPEKLQTYRGSGLQFEMASFPEEEDELEESFRWYRPKAGDLVFDIGAHCGVSTHHLSEMVGPEGKVVAFEPDPGTFKLLKRNIERYNLKNVILQNGAVAGTSGKLQFSAEGTVGSMLMSVLPRESAGSVVTVDAMTLADAFAQWGVPNFCKIDIEGAEIDVITRSADLLRAHKTNFSLDTCHLKPNGESTHSDIETLFRSYGYEATSEAKPLMATWARPS